MSITRAQRARFHDYAPTPDDIEAVMLALDTATDRLSNERAKRSRAEDRAVRAEAQSETRRQQTAYWQERAEGFEARIQAVEAEIERHEKHLGLDPLIPANRIRRALDAP